MTGLIIANSDAALAAKAVCPESLKSWLGAGHSVVGKDEPSTKDWLGKNIEDGIAKDFSVESDKSTTISNTPNDWVDGPEDESEGSKRGEESLGLVVLGSSSISAVVHNLVDDDEVSDAGPNVPAPLLSVTVAIGGKKTGQNHDEISNDCNKDVGTTETSQESKVKQQEWGCNAPVDISCPVDLSVCDLLGIWESMLVTDSLDDLVVVDTVTSGHGEIGEEGEGCDKGSQDVEQSLGSWDSESQAVEDKG